MKKFLFVFLMFYSFSAFAIEWCFQSDINGGQKYYVEMTNPRKVPSGHYGPPIIPTYIVNGFSSLNGIRFPVIGSAILNNKQWSYTITANYVSTSGVTQLNQVLTLNSNFGNGKAFNVGDITEYSLFAIDCSEVK